MPSDAKQTPAAQKNPAVGRAGEEPRPLDPRQERLARALRDNLKKRKAQQRQRQDAAQSGAGSASGDDTPAGS